MKNIRKTIMVGTGIVIVMVLAGVSVYALSVGGIGTDTAKEQSEAVTKSEAEAIALEQVEGASEADITGSEIDRDAGGTEYDIEIVYGGYEYDFEISADDGRILDQSREVMQNRSGTKTDADQKNVVVDGEYESDTHDEESHHSSTISRSKAESIALAQVKGAVKSDIVKSEKDHDDGRVEYDIEIVYGGYEYEFEIDGHTGKITSKDVERED